MKTKIINVLIVFLLSISITGCSSGKKSLNLNNSSTNSNKISDTSVPTDPSSTSLDSNSENPETQMLSNTRYCKHIKKYCRTRLNSLAQITRKNYI